MSAAYAYREHQVKAHLFGHEHLSGGESVDEMGVRFFNGATKIAIHELSI